PAPDYSLEQTHRAYPSADKWPTGGLFFLRNTQVSQAHSHNSWRQWVTVSGLARGIDAEAHLGVVDSDGLGVAVLGSGSNVIYPAEHRELHDRLIEAGGGVVTEYPPGTPPEAWRFPPRNRIISGLAAAVVVVEAAVKGGALITANAALDQAKVVLAVPGDVEPGPYRTRRPPDGQTGEVHADETTVVPHACEEAPHPHRNDHGMR
ncbi:MAG: hypothetical protein GWP18_06170, partial [Proteobacteria bacterium]|nr:hypothetical protein [Pseudomonadota bacterium]